MINWKKEKPSPVSAGLFQLVKHSKDVFLLLLLLIVNTTPVQWLISLLSYANEKSHSYNTQHVSFCVLEKKETDIFLLLNWYFSFALAVPVDPALTQLFRSVEFKIIFSTPSLYRHTHRKQPQSKTPALRSNTSHKAKPHLVFVLSGSTRRHLVHCSSSIVLAASNLH